jgi:myo-inositol-1(or 4)-monophosphatase
VGAGSSAGVVSELLEVAEEAALAAGEVLRPRFEAGAEQALGTKSSVTDPVSQADLEAEAAIRAVLTRRRPSDRVLGEEGATSSPLADVAQGATSAALDSISGGGYLWVVDPLDGTANFLQGIPVWCVSVAVRDGEGAVAGAVLDPLRGELFSASRGGEARLGDAVLNGSACTELARAIVGTGFAYDAGVRAGQGEVVGRLLSRIGNLRRHGACALDLAWAAAGRLDAFYERAIEEWDVAAGELLCRQAGLVVERLPPCDGMPAGILAAPSALADELRAAVS